MAATLEEVFVALDSLPDLVREKRATCGLSMRTVAAQAGVSFSTVDRAEKGADLTVASARALLVWAMAPPAG